MANERFIKIERLRRERARLEEELKHNPNDATLRDELEKVRRELDREEELEREEQDRRRKLPGHGR
ncbi:MAG: hypothetical protein PHR35_14100 [Kiritimatiellae bacterium]|nr:hypothetical protein [Kiritimatiellia bacterium]